MALNIGLQEAGAFVQAAAGSELAVVERMGVSGFEGKKAKGFVLQIEVKPLSRAGIGWEARVVEQVGLIDVEAVLGELGLKEGVAGFDGQFARWQFVAEVLIEQVALREGVPFGAAAAGEAVGGVVGKVQAKT